ncbi:MAG: spermidine/putrescine ABC transporter substrate-binding protein [Candidatus Nanopelagicales bacterium]
MPLQPRTTPTPDPTPRSMRMTLSRRRLLVGGGALAGAGLLAACGASDSAGDPSASATTSGTPSPSITSSDRSDTDPAVAFSNWPFYIDTAEDGGTSTLQDFEAETGIAVEYIEDINDNEEFWAKVSPQLEMGQPIDRDIIVVTDDYARRFIRAGWAEPIDPANVPNKANLIASLQNREWDPDRTWTLPWQNGIVGFGVNNDAAGGKVTSFEQLLGDDFTGKVSISSEMSDTMIFFLLLQGSDPQDFTDDEFQQALAAFQAAFDRGQFRKVTGNDYAGDLVDGNVAAAIGYSGDVFQLNLENPAVEFVVPQEGGGYFSDVMVIPAGAEHHRNAERLMDYYYDPLVAAKLAAWVQYLTPVQGAQEAMAEVDPEQVENPAIFPSEAELASAHPFMALNPDTELDYIRAYQRVILS